MRGYIERSHVTKSWAAIKSFIAEQLGFKLDDKEAQGVARFLKHKCQYNALLKAYITYWVYQNTSQVFFNGDWVVIDNTDGLISAALPKAKLEKKIIFACRQEGCYHVADGLYSTIKIPFEKGRLLTLIP